MSYQTPATGSTGSSADVGPHLAHAAPSLAQMLRAVGADIASLVEVPSGDGDLVSGAVFHDSAAPPSRSPGAIALAIGLDLSGHQLPAQLVRLKVAGCSAVAYKAHQVSDLALRTAARSADVALIRVQDEVPWRRLAEIIDAAAAAHGPSHEALADIAPGDLFELANAVASLVGGAVAIADLEQTLLAYSTLPEHPIDETRRASILQLHVPHTEQNDRDYRRVHSSQGIVSVAAGEQSFTRSAVAIRAGTEVLGSLWLIDSPDGGTDDCGRALLEAANVAALHLLHHRTNHDSARRRQIELVAPLLFEPGRAELSAVQLGIFVDTVRVAAISAWGSGGNAPATMQFGLRLFDTVRTACAVWLPTAVCGLADNVVYVLLPDSTADETRFHRDAMLRIVRHARRLLARPVLAGLGPSVPIATVANSRADAESVLAVLLGDVEQGRIQVESDDVVADRESLGSRLMLRQLVEQLRATGHLPGDYAIRIGAHDTHRGTSFAETIRTYLDCGANAIETAERLGLHPNTVRYRLSRVEKLFGVRLEDPETRLLVWLQLWSLQS